MPFPKASRSDVHVRFSIEVDDTISSPFMATITMIVIKWLASLPSLDKISCPFLTINDCFLGGTELLQTPRYSLAGGVLRIKSLSVQDKGVYECEATNSVGKVHKSITLALTGKFFRR